MPDLRPFRGILYNAQKIEDVARVVCEPYDVISPAQRNAYYNSHPYNVIRLILGKTYAQDSKSNNQYTRAKKFFNDWQRQHILLEDKKASIYIYAQSFVHNNKRRTRSGFIVLLKLEEFAKNVILPHEHTNPLAVRDRLKLMQKTRANLSPIFALFSDPCQKTNKILSRYKRSHPPCINIKKDGIIHKVWRMNDRLKIKAIKQLLKEEQIFIADGHHRYEAALNYKKKMQKKTAAGSAPFDYVMTYLIATADSGLAILPTHRVVAIKKGFNRKAIVRQFKNNFTLQSFSSAEQMLSCMRESPAADHTFGVYFGKNKFSTLKLKRRKGAYKELDVAILHSDIIEGVLNKKPRVENINYIKDVRQAINLVDQSGRKLAFFLNPPTVRQLKKVAASGARMPHKSTYFYPKLLTGLVINRI